MLLRSAALAATALLSFACATPPSGGGAAAGSCVLVGGPKSPAEVRVYDSYPYGSPGGRRIFIGLLNFGERQAVTSPTGKIWFAYRWHEGDSWKDGVELPCRDGQELALPP